MVSGRRTRGISCGVSETCQDLKLIRADTHKEAATKGVLWKRCSQSRTLTFQKKSFYLLPWKPFKNDEKCFFFVLKAHFVLKIFKFLSWHFGHVEKTAWLKR